MRDFSLRAFELLCMTFLGQDYSFETFSSYLQDGNSQKVILLRHDVDRMPESALNLAAIENRLGITASYYFRAIDKYFDERVVEEIVNLGHEIGYHYEDLSLAKGNFERAIQRFQDNLENMRKYYPVKTICMHGNPLSKWDNRLLWQRYDYFKYEIIGEPYFDLDFDSTLYLTDTGRSWNCKKGNIRDTVSSKLAHEFRSTFDIVVAALNDELPEKLMLNIHPHRWTNRILLWVKELIWQKTKNLGKGLIKR